MFEKVKNWVINGMERNTNGGFNVGVEDQYGYQTNFDYSDVTQKFYWASGYKCEMPKYLQKAILEIASKKGWEVEFGPTAEEVKTAANKARFTEGEQAVINYLIGYYWEKHFSDLTVEEVADAIGKPSKSVRGYVSSLIKKGICWVSEQEGDVPPLIYFTEEGYKLDPEYDEKWNDGDILR